MDRFSVARLSFLAGSPGSAACLFSSCAVPGGRIQDECRAKGPQCAACIKGAGNKSSVGVLVARTSCLVLLARMDDATAASALAGFSAKLNSMSAFTGKPFAGIKWGIPGADDNK